MDTAKAEYIIGQMPCKSKLFKQFITLGQSYQIMWL